MKLLRLLLPLLMLPCFARAASPTFAQTMWTNNGSRVLLSPERSTNRVDVGTNMLAFGGIGPTFPAWYRDGGNTNALINSDRSGFASLTAGQIRSRSQGIYLDTEDSATPFAYSLFFRKKGDTGNTNSTIAQNAEMGNMQWQGWDGSAYVSAASILVRAEQAFSGSSAGTHFLLRLTPTNAVLGTEHSRFVFASGAGGGATNPMITFNGITDTFPALKRFGRQLQIRNADNTGFADFVASNSFFAGPMQITGNLALIRNVAYTWPSANANGLLTNDGSGNLGYLAASALAGPWLTSNNIIAPSSTSFPGLKQGLVNTEAWNPTNTGFGSIGFGSNTVPGGYFSSVLGGGSNAIATNSPFSAIVGGEINYINQAAGGHNFIGGGFSNIVSATTSNSYIGGGFGNIIIAAVRAGSIGGGTTNRVDNAGGTVAGGFGNYAGGLASTAVGGQQNVAGNTSGSDWVFVGGGQQNQVNPDYGTIVGGLTNFVQNNGSFGFIGGGHGNDVNSDVANVPGGSKNIINITSPHSFIMGGTSNNVAQSTAQAGVVGSHGTNSTPASVLISPRGTAGSNMLHVTATASTNIGPLFVRANTATTYARVGGVLTNDLAPSGFRTNHTGAGNFTNLCSYVVPANALLNAGDTVIIYLRGNFAKNVATTNDFKALWGSATLFDTGFKEASNCTWEAWVEITAKTSTSQVVGSKVHWIMNGAAGAVNNGALSIYSTNSVESQTTTATNIFVFQGASRTAATITNDLMKVTYEGYPNF